jgi:hypothetical protein
MPMEFNKIFSTILLQNNLVKSFWNEIYETIEHLASLKFPKCKSKEKCYIVEDLTPKLVDKTN